MDLVSIIIPTFNRVTLLEETLDSVSRQTYQNWECIIIDDGCLDNTERRVKERQVKDSRFRYYKRSDDFPKGANGCRNFGFLKSKGDYIQWLDDDDLLSETKLEVQVSFLSKYGSNNLLVTCPWDLLWPGKKMKLKDSFSEKPIYSAKEFFKNLYLKQTFVPSNSYLVPRPLSTKAGFWDSNLTINQDAEYFTRVLLKSDGLVSTNDCYVLYREHEGKRVSRQRGNVELENLLLGLRVMQANLKACDVDHSEYFRWKLMKIFHDYHRIASKTLIKHRYFLKENGVNLNLASYYTLRYKIYKIVFPEYKKLKKLFN